MVVNDRWVRHAVAGVQAPRPPRTCLPIPDVNDDFMTSLTGQPVDQVRTLVQNYLDANPQTKADIQSIRQPLADKRERCGPPLLDQP